MFEILLPEKTCVLLRGNSTEKSLLILLAAKYPP
jgi:hypothetical protein